MNIHGRNEEGCLHLTSHVLTANILLKLGRDGCLYVKEPPKEYTIEYARWADRTMYLVSHQDKVHGECQYILAHYQVEDSQRDECSLSPAVEGKEVVLQFGDKHHEVEVSSDS